MIRFFIVALMVAVVGCASPTETSVGIESFVKKPPGAARGKRIGLITNHTGADRKGVSDIDLIRGMDSVQLVALFGPEHGIRGDAHPGEKIASSTDAKTGLPVHSLYGELRKPTPEMLKDVDVLVFDIQDVGARCYTYPYTMALGMEAAKEKGIPFIVLDRPNPIGGEMIESNILDPKFASFVGKYAIPMRHGMTVGELASMFNTQFGIGADLTVIPTKHWRRNTWWDKTGMKWVAPSPNLPTFESAIHYPGTVAFEGTNLSCGRGTSHPFEQIGAPWLDSQKVIEAMNRAGVAGVRFEPVSFTPTSAGDKKFEGQLCHGVRLVVLDRNVYRPVRTSAILVDAIRSLHSSEFKFRVGHFDVLAGTDKLRLAIEAGTLPDYLKTWDADEAAFREMRKKYLLYE
jgi:uncharacterized protein YbbC (DUF1343 family)